MYRKWPQGATFYCPHISTQATNCRAALSRSQADWDIEGCQCSPREPCLVRCGGAAGLARLCGPTEGGRGCCGRPSLTHHPPGQAGHVCPAPPRPVAPPGHSVNRKLRDPLRTASESHCSDITLWPSATIGPPQVYECVAGRAGRCSQNN